MFRFASLAFGNRKIATVSASDLTHWGRVTHVCVIKLTIIDSDNGLSPERHQAIIWTNAGILLIGTSGTNFSETLSEIHTFSFKKVHWKTSFARWRPFCLGLNVLILKDMCKVGQNHINTVWIIPAMYFTPCNITLLHQMSRLSQQLSVVKGGNKSSMTTDPTSQRFIPLHSRSHCLSLAELERQWPADVMPLSPFNNPLIMAAWPLSGGVCVFGGVTVNKINVRHVIGGGTVDISQRITMMKSQLLLRDNNRGLARDHSSGSHILQGWF